MPDDRRRPKAFKVNQQNRTIEISASSSIKITADRVTIVVGFHNYGPSHEAAFDQNSRVAAQILKAWKDAGVSEKKIATKLFELPDRHSRDDLEGHDTGGTESKSSMKFFSPGESRKPRTLRKSSSILLSMPAPTTLVRPEWALADAGTTESQAYASALMKAHAIADQMAKSFGGKVGSLLYASNEQRQMGVLGGVAGGMAGGVIRRSVNARPETKLLPQKIEKTGYVRAIFALE